MKLNIVTRVLSVITIVFGLTFASSAFATEPETVASLLFDKPYLTSVKPDTTLVYDFKRISSDEQKYGQGLSDTIRLDVLKDEKDSSKRTAHLHIYSGPRARNIGPIPQTSGNPAIMILLEQDTYDFKRHLGGIPAYFRNKIRKAMRESAKIEQTRIKHNGREISGHKITLVPFTGDPNMQRVPEYQNTIYEFVVSDEVPGGIVSISSTIPGTQSGSAVLRKQYMSFNSQEAK
ncbi:hypothetical protein [Anderseniella sp. Alg231-50]|uniref:hypothetical protein n=1 Tax=Anderseniella sp. Alg231-50 TaxID=1922226 RepID=UPI00307B4E33